MKKCPDHAGQVRADARVCEHRGYRFDEGSRSKTKNLLPVDMSKSRSPKGSLVGWRGNRADQDCYGAEQVEARSV